MKYRFLPAKPSQTFRLTADHNAFGIGGAFVRHGDVVEMPEAMAKRVQDVYGRDCLVRADAVIVVGEASTARDQALLAERVRQQVDHVAELQAENDDLRRQMQGAARALALTEMVAVALAEGHARRGQVAKALGAADDADPKAFLLGVIEMMRDGPTPAEAQLDAAAAIIAGWR